MLIPLASKTFYSPIRERIEFEVCGRSAAPSVAAMMVSEVGTSHIHRSVLLTFPRIAS